MKNIKKTIKKKLLNSDSGTLIFYKARVLREWVSLTLLNDYAYIKKQYKKSIGTEIDLKHPRNFSEKLQWLKLFYHNENMPICSDKYNIRFYLQKHGYEHLLNDIIAVYETPEEIDKLNVNSLPKSFVAKATHGSGWNLICKNKNEINWRIWKKTFKQWLELDLSVFGREWNYRDVKPQILIEKYIDHRPLNDYKFMCFNGEPKLIQFIQDIGGKRKLDLYNTDWEMTDIAYTGFEQSHDISPKPLQLDEMLKIARDLSREFPFVRVDFYNFNGKIILGELTFFPTSGFSPVLPFDYEILLGSWIKLPKANHNIKLYNKINA